MSARQYLCYTYLIGWSNLDLWYYGVRYAQTNRKQDYDLWVDYFTHSKPVKHMRAFIGEPDVIHYDKIFMTEQDARKYESKVLIEHNCKNSSYWLNKHDKLAPPIMNGNNNGMYGREQKESSKQKMRLAKKDIYLGNNNPFFGKKHPNRKKVQIYNKIYESITEASNIYNVDRNTIRYWIKINKAKYV